MDDVVRLVDVAPTILKLSGAAKLPDPTGRDLLPLVFGDDSEPKDAYFETLATQLDHGWSPLLGIRSGWFNAVDTMSSRSFEYSFSRAIRAGMRGIEVGRSMTFTSRRTC